MAHLDAGSRLEARIADHLHVLVEAIGARPPGTPANRTATDYVAGCLGSAGGLVVDELPFTARFWTPGRVALECCGSVHALPPSPFSSSVTAEGAVTRLRTVAELEAAVRSEDLVGRILLVEGELAAEPYFPRAFPFVSIPEQLAVLELLERARPAAVIAVAPTSRPAATSPVFEDPDLEFAYLTAPPEVAEHLVDGSHARVVIDGSVVQGDGVNVSARRGGDAPGVVLSAHIDSKATTAGALDNAGGVALVLALAELGLPIVTGLEYVFFNGEDHYAAPGEQAWLAARDLGRIRLAVNVDGPGLVGYPVSVACLAMADGDVAFVQDALGPPTPLVPAEPWFESDHAIFAMAGIPSLAVTSAAPHDLLTALAHAPESRVDDVDTAVLAATAVALADVVEQLAHRLLGTREALAPR